MLNSQTKQVSKTFLAINPTMDSSNDKQTNPGKTLPFTGIVHIIENFIVSHPKLKSKPSLEHHPIPQSEPSLEATAITTATTTSSGNSSPNAATKSEGNNSSKGREEDRRIDYIL